MIPNTNLPTAKTHENKKETTLNPLLRCHSLWWIGSTHLVSCIRFSHFVRNDFLCFRLGTGMYIYIYTKQISNKIYMQYRLAYAIISNPEWPHDIIQYLDLHFSTKHSFGSDLLQLMFFFGGRQGRLNIWKPLSCLPTQLFWPPL